MSEHGCTQLWLESERKRERAEAEVARLRELIGRLGARIASCPDPSSLDLLLIQEVEREQLCRLT